MLLILRTFAFGFGERGSMPRKKNPDTLSVYVPEAKRDKNLVKRLYALGEKRERSLNYLVVDAILTYLEREEGKE